MMDSMTLAFLVAIAGGQAVAEPVKADRAAKQPASQPATTQSSLKIREGEQIVAMGDSITELGGYLRVIDKVFATQYPELHIPKVINAGVSGNKAEDMVARFEKDVVARKPNIVTISVGINDVWHRLDKPHDPQVLETFTKNLDRMVQMAQEAGARVIVLSPTVIQEDVDSEGNKRLKMYIDAGQKVARKRGVEYVDLNKMFMKVIKRRERLEKRAASTSPADSTHHQLTTDGVHMKPMGDTLMAVGVLKMLGVPDEKISATDLSEVFEKK
jgi:lysophospholipase L1-like esterase